MPKRSRLGGFWVHCGCFVWLHLWVVPIVAPAQPSPLPASGFGCSCTSTAAGWPEPSGLASRPTAAVGVLLPLLAVELWGWVIGTGSML